MKYFKTFESLNFSSFNKLIDFLQIKSVKKHNIAGYERTKKNVLVITESDPALFEKIAKKYKYIFHNYDILNDSEKYELLEKLPKRKSYNLIVTNNVNVAIGIKSKCEVFRTNLPINSKKLLDFDGKMGVFENVVNRKKDDEIFNYRSIIQDEWRKIVKKAKDFQKISFDLENNESTGQKKTIYIKKNLRKDQPVKYEFNCELYEAGGDWECPVMYFCVEFTHQYSVLNSKYEKNPEYVFDLPDNADDKIKLSHSYVFIPPVEAGNPLNKTEKGFAAWEDDSLHAAGLKSKDVQITAEKEKKAWKWLEEFLTKVVEDRHEMLDEPSKAELLKQN